MRIFLSSLDQLPSLPLLFSVSVVILSLQLEHTPIKNMYQLSEFAKRRRTKNKSQRYLFFFGSILFPRIPKTSREVIFCSGKTDLRRFLTDIHMRGVLGGHALTIWGVMYVGWHFAVSTFVLVWME
ncbi:hypothetical protein CDAR_232301 [Caerostris darwini]|uniref:Uncharacterized protein n=1 Tax=Caerostris darwini TaxID=1538125 RepID=A0AAV4W7X4_9ARAC|nr:hypothetical protein CDAR_232301 [Caerostris darwini]